MKREIHLHQNCSFDACLFAFICQLSLLFLVNVVKIEKLQTRRQTLENYVLLLTVCISFETCTIKILCCFKIVHFYPVCCSLETAVFELFIRNNFFRSLHLENRETIFFLSWISSGNKAQKMYEATHYLHKWIWIVNLSLTEHILSQSAFNDLTCLQFYSVILFSIKWLLYLMKVLWFEYYLNFASICWKFKTHSIVKSKVNVDLTREPKAPIDKYKLFLIWNAFD